MNRLRTSACTHYIFTLSDYNNSCYIYYFGRTPTSLFWKGPTNQSTQRASLSSKQQNCEEEIQKGNKHDTLAVVLVRISQ